MSNRMPLVLDEAVAGPSARIDDSSTLTLLDSEDVLAVPVDVQRFK
jgi:hypothetical protein